MFCQRNGINSIEKMSRNTIKCTKNLYELWEKLEFHTDKIIFTKILYIGKIIDYVYYYILEGAFYEIRIQNNIRGCK